ncbi:MAG: MerR family transcriptional regulator [Propionibacteriales bacterium]|nr:MerR family transcriptional regulator [Propionibacteriales bacterium]
MSHLPAGAAKLTVDELASRVGMTVRTVRFYAGRGLLPPPERKGRSGYYGADHLARLELVRELQAHGFTLAAIEGYLERIPEHATPQDIALHRTLLAPWMPDLPETLDRPSLEQRAGRSLSDDDIEVLVGLGIVEPTPDEDVFRVAPALVAVGVDLVDLGLPHDAVVAAQRVFTEHGRAIAEELTEIFRTQVWPHYREQGEPPERLQQLVERFKPVSVQALVMAYESAVDEAKRDTVRRSGRRPGRRR